MTKMKIAINFGLAIEFGKGKLHEIKCLKAITDIIKKN
jgi:hypothetical protein